MNLIQLHYFVAVAEEGTISAAARKLHISQPPLSVQIKNLEEEYGLPLLERGARHVRLTPAGELLYRYALRMIEMEEAARDDLQGLRAGLAASIRLGVVSSGECGEFLEGVSAFRALHPEVSFRIYDGNTYELLQALERQQVELALVRTPYQAPETQSIVLRTDAIAAVGRAEVMAGLPQGPITLSALGDRPLILYRRWQEILQREMGQEQVSAQIVCINDDARTSLQWASAGLGIALVPESVLPLVPGLESHPLSEQNLRTSIHLIRRRGRSISPSAEAWFSLMRERAEGGQGERPS